MKGIAHFTAGVAAASFFPGAVAAAVDGNPLYFVLGGVCGLLPDTLDFKFGRFFYRHQVEITPDPLGVDPAAIAAGVAAACRRASDSGRAVTVKLNTVKLGADRWQQYRLRFDVPEGKLTVTVGPVVDTGQNVLVAEPARPRSATAELPCRLRLDYESETVIDIFDGPVFSMQPHSEGYVVPVFIPWHRSWSHSILVGLAGALIAGLVWGPRAAAVAAAAHAAHVFEDQLGYMGNNLFYPFRKRRVPGLALTHSGATAANLAAVWLCCLLILWNLARAARPPVPGLTLAHLLLYAFILPGAMLMLARRVLAKTSRRPDVRTAGGVDGDSRAT